MAEWITVAQAAVLLGKNERTIRRWIEKDKIPHKRTASGIVVNVEGQSPTPPDTPPIDALIAENERLKAEIKGLSEDKEFLQNALVASLSTTNRLIGAGQQSDNDNDIQEAKPDTRRRWYWPFGDA